MLQVKRVKPGRRSNVRGLRSSVYLYVLVPAALALVWILAAGTSRVTGRWHTAAAVGQDLPGADGLPQTRRAARQQEQLRLGQEAMALPGREERLMREGMLGSDGSGGSGGGGRGGAVGAAQGSEQGLAGPTASSLTVHASANSKGLPKKYYYTYRNVKLSMRELEFYTPPGYKHPTKPHVVDVITCNATRPNPPTVLAIKGETKNIAWFHLPVKYTTQPGWAGTCKGWVDKPAYLLQVRHSHNVWHTWNEGLMGVFQTLRELGELPLVQVDTSGNVREVTEGMGTACAMEYDPATNTTAPAKSCPPKTGVVSGLNLGPQLGPGVWSVKRDNGPLILAYTPGSLSNPWAHLYSAISKDVRHLSDLEGWCFRSLTVGKTSTLNFYQQNSAHESPTTQEQRVEATAVFKAFARTAQQEWVQQQAAAQPALAQYQVLVEVKRGMWGGYEEAAMERLRRGVGPEDIALAGSIMPFEVPGGTGEESAEELQRAWLWRRVMEVQGRLAELQAGAAAGGGGQLLPPLERRTPAFSTLRPLVPKGPLVLESPRPVVTYMSRRHFSRAVLNEHDLLRYILSRYNITLHVTTLEEPLLEVMELLQHTDVLIGMHGAGWTNGLFLKHSAAAVQLYPYGWRLHSGKAIRGFAYREIVLGNECRYLQWFNPHPQYAFFRDEDFNLRMKEKFHVKFHLHPEPGERLPTNSWPPNHWIYQNTYVDMASLGPVIDKAMHSVGIRPVRGHRYGHGQWHGGDGEVGQHVAATAAVA